MANAPCPEGGGSSDPSAAVDERSDTSLPAKKGAIDDLQYRQPPGGAEHGRVGRVSHWIHLALPNQQIGDRQALAVVPIGQAYVVAATLGKAMLRKTAGSFKIFTLN